jgi:RHS repeat-associated protein
VKKGTKFLLNGDLFNDGFYKYYYDIENKLLDVNDKSTGNPIASYEYDCQDRRVKKTVYGSPDVITKYCYDGEQVIAEYDGEGTLLRKFIYGPGIDEPICMIEVGETEAIYYYHFDGLGSVIALSNVNNEIVEQYSYDVFGKPNATSSINNPYMFTGRRYDVETGLYYYRARYYDYANGRFISPDPAGFVDGFNFYTYCSNDSVNCTDAVGLKGLFRPHARLRVTTEDGKTTTYTPKNGTDIVKVIINAKVTGNKIKTFEYFGHADTAGGGLTVAVKKQGDDILYQGIYNFDPFPKSIDTYKIDSLKGLIIEAFDPEARIVLAGCCTARQNANGLNIAQSFKKILPDAQVWGYTGIADVDTLLMVHRPDPDSESTFRLVELDSVRTAEERCKK